MPKQVIEVEVPEGYRAVKHGPLKVGDIFQNANGRIAICDYPIRSPCLILEKIEEKLPMKEETQEKPTVIVDCKIPEGFELQGEFRIPKHDEWFINSIGGAQICEPSGRFSARIILKKRPVTQEVTLKLTPPEGFRFTGEYQIPELGDWYVSVLNESKAVQVSEGEVVTYSRFILEKVDA